MALEQWVNLPKDEKFTNDGDGATLERCGKVSIEVMFLKDDVPISYKVKVTPVGSDNAVYTKKEMKRNPNFKMTKGTLRLSDKKNVLLEESIQFPAAGGNIYKIEAKDANGKVASTTVEIETHRKLYYQIISMDDKNSLKPLNKVPSYSLSSMERHSLKHYIKLMKKGSERKIPYIKTITMQDDDNNLDYFGQEVDKAFNLDAKLRNLGTAAVFSDYISSMGQDEYSETVTIGTENPRCAWNNTELFIAGDMFLWHGLDDSHDKAKKWFIDGYIAYTDTATGASEGYFIDRADIEIVGKKQFTHGGYHIVKINIDSNLQVLLSKTQGQLEFIIEVNIANGWTNGFSWKPGNVDLITCARRVEWEDMPTITQEYTWNHEVGHRFGMTAWGNSKYGVKTQRKKLPDGPTTLYGENYGVNDNEHQGPHCSNGAEFNASTRVWSKSPGCVMFGANGIGNKHSPKEYCSECAPIVRKLDLSS